jgi:hypothetical protein
MFIRYLVRGVVDVEVRWDDKLAKFAGEVTEAVKFRSPVESRSGVSEPMIRHVNSDQNGMPDRFLPS